MRVIVPGGYYSYDSAGKKIWLDYQYYGATLENISFSDTQIKIKRGTAAERTALVTALKDEALEVAKIQAQKRANDMADKAILRSLITALNQTVGIDFEGTVEIPQE